MRAAAETRLRRGFFWPDARPLRAPSHALSFFGHRLTISGRIRTNALIRLVFSQERDHRVRIKSAPKGRKMVEAATALEQGYTPDTGEKSRLLTFDHLDGRTLAMRKVRQVEAEIASDLGGPEGLSEAQRALARRAAVLSAVLEDAEARWALGERFDLQAYLAAVNALRRVLATLGLERRMRDAVPALHDYLASKAKGAA